jgi:hypothetical protein
MLICKYPRLFKYDSSLFRVDHPYKTAMSLFQVIDEFPSLLLPAVMQTLHREYMKNGMEWLRQNVVSLRSQLMHLQKLYGSIWILA